VDNSASARFDLVVPDDFDSEEVCSDEPPPASLTRELFLEWRSPRRGSANPERMNNPVWEWLIQSRWNAWRVSEHFEAPTGYYAGPGWCFTRFGRSTTELPDGRKVLIAGEHEDSYDSDFYIYNDVVVVHPDGAIDIFGYAPEVFPPTDFHSATRVGDRIVVIGNLGYPDDRKPGVTQVAVLDLQTFAFALVETVGAGPGWLHKHSGLSADGVSILVRGGKIDPGPEGKRLLENIDDWRLHLDGWRWERLTDRQWPSWAVIRKDGERLHLWEIGMAKFDREMGWKDAEQKLKEVEQALGKTPDFGVLECLYRPAVPHEPIEDREEEFRVKRIRIGEVVVRYVEDSWSIQITVEGTLAQEVIDALVEDARGKLALLENAECEARRLRP
jgi:hypothetical protein